MYSAVLSCFLYDWGRVFANELYYISGIWKFHRVLMCDTSCLMLYDFPYYSWSTHETMVSNWFPFYCNCTKTVYCVAFSHKISRLFLLFIITDAGLNKIATNPLWIWTYFTRERALKMFTGIQLAVTSILVFDYYPAALVYLQYLVHWGLFLLFSTYSRDRCYGNSHSPDFEYDILKGHFSLYFRLIES